MTCLGGAGFAEEGWWRGGRPRRGGCAVEVPGAKVTRLGGGGEVPGGEEGRLVEVRRAGGSARGGGRGGAWGGAGGV